MKPMWFLIEYINKCYNEKKEHLDLNKIFD
jgi:hypothetical protein